MGDDDLYGAEACLRDAEKQNAKLRAEVERLRQSEKDAIWLAMENNKGWGHARFMAAGWRRLAEALRDGDLDG